MKRLSTKTLENELALVKRALHRQDYRSEHDREALYGAMQALSWALGKDAQRPYMAFTKLPGVPERASHTRGDTDAQA